MPTILDDTAAWTVLSTSFLPDSAYRYVQIGTFFADSLVAWSILDPSGDWDGAYAFVDMVCVSKASGECDPISSLNSPSPTSWPRTIVFSDELELALDQWRLDGAIEKLELLDSSGRLVARRILHGWTGTVRWSLAGLTGGAYYLRLQLRDRPSVVIRSWKI
jgi:hypothetical protein